jgi:serralysin
VITDFERGSDLLHFSGIDANAFTSGDQAFNFIGTSAFTGAAGQLRYSADFFSRTTIVEGDVNGDMRGEFWIELMGVTPLSISDLVL